MDFSTVDCDELFGGVMFDSRGNKFFSQALMGVFVLMSLLAMAVGDCFGATVTITGPNEAVNGSQYTASGGAAPYTWCISKGSITQSGVVTVTGQCGSSSITVTDSCGTTDSKVVRMPYGVWVSIKTVGSSSDCSYNSGTFNCITYGGTTVPVFWYSVGGYWFYCADYSSNCSASTGIGINASNPPMIVGNAYTWNTFKYTSLTHCAGKTPAELLCSDCGLGSNLNNLFILSTNYTTYEWRCQDGSNGSETTCSPPPCLTITGFNSSSSAMKLGESVTFSGAISKPADWTITVADRTFSGTGTSASATWDGKDSTGNYVGPGQHTATLTARNCNGSCTDSKTADVSIQCDLASIRATPQTIDPSSGGHTEIVGGVITTSPMLLCGLTIAGITVDCVGSSASITWDGRDNSGKIVAPGIHRASFGYTTIGGCGDSKFVDIKVIEGPKACSLKGPA